MATVNARAHPAHMLQHLVQAKSEISAQGEAEVQLGGRSFRLKRQFIDDIEGHKLDAIVARLGKVMMVFHAPHDQTVGIDSAAHLFTAARHPKNVESGAVTAGVAPGPCALLHRCRPSGIATGVIPPRP